MSRFGTISCVALLLAAAAPFSTGFGFHATERLLHRMFGFAAPATSEQQVGAGMILDITEFRYESCGTENSPLSVKTLSVGPSGSLSIPGSFPLTLAFDINQNLTAPVKAVLQLYKKEFSVWVKLPCQIGPKNICTYNDMCELLPPPPCPSLLIQNHIPCECPARAGSYEIKDYTADVTNVAIRVPGWLVNGEYKIEVSLHDANNSALGCLRLFMHITERR